MTRPAARPDAPDPAPAPSPAARPPGAWRVVDIVVASVLAVAVGVVFWGWSAGYAGVAALTAAFPPLAGLYGGGWLLAGILGALIVRRPGAALYCELVAAVVEGFLGTHFGWTVVISGLAQGLAAELVFASFRYRRWTLPVALLAGALAGLVLGATENVLYHVEWAAHWKRVYVVLTAISGTAIAGVLPWLAVRALARTGVLSGLASRSAAAEPTR